MISNLSNLKTVRKLTLLFALLAVTISWTGGLQSQSDEYVTEALQSGAIVYATARGINGVVSFMQGTELSPAFLTFAVGEFLDPVNDLIERFSGLLMLALGSLSLQKILLEIFGHYGFSVLMTSLFILLSLSATYARFAAWFDPLLKLFLVTLALHFMVSAVVMASAAVDQVFLQKADKERHANMTELHQELQTLSKARPGAPAKAEVAAATAQLAALRDLESDQQQEIEKLRRELANLKRELAGMRSEVSMLCRLNPMCDEGESINAKKRETLEKQAELGFAESANELTAAQIKELLAYLGCAAKQQAGNACTFWGQAYSLVSPTEWKQRLSIVDAKMNRYADNIITLLVSWLAKAIVIPLFFLYSLIHLYKLVLRKLFAGDDVRVERIKAELPET